MNTGQNPSISKPIPGFSLSRELKVCLGVVLACHVLMIGWIGFAGLKSGPDITPPMTGMLLSGGSQTGSGNAGQEAGGSQAIRPSTANENKKKAGNGKMQEATTASKAEQKTLPASKKAASSAPSGNEMNGSPKTGTQAANSSGAVTGHAAERGAGNGKGSDANGTGSSGKGGKGLSGPYTDAGFYSNPKPPYPPVSRRMAEEGNVLLSVHIRSDGQVDEVKLKRSSGFSRLDDSAIRTVRKWRYVPAKKNGQPIPYWYVQPIRFSLDD